MSLILSGTDGLSDIDGSAATPALRGTDANTGIFFPAADTIAFSEGGAEAMRIDSSGNVGIGTSSPGGRLNVSGTSVFGALNNVYALQIGYNNTRAVVGQTYYIGATDSATPSLVFSDAGAIERMRIDSSGNLLVGTTSVTNTGKVISAFNGSLAVGFVANDTASASGGVYFGCSLNGTFIGSIQRVGATSAVVYNTASDKRLKSNITDSNSVLPTLMNVKVRQYDWTGGDLHQDYGFIAQELEPILSGIVTKGKTDDDIWQLDYSRLTPHLVKAIQEQQALIVNMRNELDALKAKVGA